MHLTISLSKENKEYGGLEFLFGLKFSFGKLWFVFNSRMREKILVLC